MTSENIPSVILPTKPDKRNYTLADFLRKEAKSSYKHEFYNGKIVKMPYAKGPHNIISMNTAVELVQQMDKLPEKYIVFGPDQLIYLPTLNAGVYADAFAVSDKPQYWDDNQLLLTNPFLVVEILSASTQKYDRTGKFEKYKTLDSFKEYLLIRQDEYRVEVYYLEEPGRWSQTIVTDKNAKVHLQSVNVELSVERIYRNIEIIN